MKIGNLQVNPGEKKRGFLPVTGCEHKLPMTVICESESPVVLITAGVHSAEYVGIQAAVELSVELEPKDVKGTLIIMPVVNLSGFEHRTMSMVYEDNKNLNREFPGNPDGTIAEKISYTLVNEMFKRTDYYIDLHSGDGYEQLYNYVYFVGAVEGKVREDVSAKALEMAKRVNVPYVVKSPVTTGGAYNEASSMGISSILLERGGRAMWSKEEVDADKRDVKNVLSYLYGWEETPVITEGQRLLEDVIYEYAPYTGLWYASFKAGDFFKKGDVLGRIKGYFGEERHVCRASADGVILYQVNSLNILEDGPMIAYSLFEEEK